jgi:hypothetical protein
MSKLTAAARSKIPPSKMGLPPDGFPMEDKSHARAAKSGASRAANVGNITKAQEKKIDAKADAVLAKKNGGPVSNLSQGYSAMGSAKSTSKKRGY